MSSLARVGVGGGLCLELSDEEDEEEVVRKEVKREQVVKKEKGPPVMIDSTSD